MPRWFPVSSGSGFDVPEEEEEEKKKKAIFFLKLFFQLES